MSIRRLVPPQLRWRRKLVNRFRSRVRTLRQRLLQSRAVMTLLLLYLAINQVLAAALHNTLLWATTVPPAFCWTLWDQTVQACQHTVHRTTAALERRGWMRRLPADAVSLEL